jgi:predicted MFS family arabinose efflux permease
MQISSTRLIVLICALAALAEVVFFSALAPLLPSLDRQLGLGHVTAGLLVAAYGVGYMLGAYPGLLISSAKGPRATTLAGTLCVVAGTATFAFGDQVAILFAGRALVGFGAVLVYTGALSIASEVAGADHRGEAIGTVYSGNAAGSALGPLLGSAAEAFGRGVVFGAVAAGQIVIAILVSRLPKLPPTPHAPLTEILSHLRSPRVRIGLWITSLPGFAIGVLVVSAAYRLDEIGSSSLAIAVAFSGIAIINVFANPVVGRLSDRLGRRTPLLYALVLTTITLIVMALLAVEIPAIILISVTGALVMAVAGPGLALVADAINDRDGDSTQATFLMNICWGPAAALGAALAGMFHSTRGAELSIGMLACVAFASVVLTYRYAR